MNTKKQMIEYISTHSQYNLMNSWNRGVGYAFNVKIHNLPLSREQKEKLYEIISDENLSEGFYSDINNVIENWEYEMIKKGYQFTGEQYFEGRGWINTSDEDYLQRMNAILARPLTLKSRQEFEEALKNNKSEYGAFTEIQTKCKFSAFFNGRNSGYLVLGKWNGHNYTGKSWVFDVEELQSMNKADVKGIYDILIEFKNLYEVLTDTCKYFAELPTQEEEITTVSTKNIKTFA